MDEVTPPISLFLPFSLLSLKNKKKKMKIKALLGVVFGVFYFMCLGGFAALLITGCELQRMREKEGQGQAVVWDVVLLSFPFPVPVSIFLFFSFLLESCRKIYGENEAF